MSLSGPITPSTISVKNSSTVVPTIVSPFVGVTEDVLQFLSLTITLATSQSSYHSGYLFFEFSPDGYFWDVSVGTQARSNQAFIPRSLRVVNRYFRLRYIPNDANLTAFRLTTTLHTVPTEDITRLLSQEVTDSDPIKLVGSILYGKETGDTGSFIQPNVISADGYNGLVTRNIPLTPSSSARASVSASVTVVTLLSSNAQRKGATVFNDSTARLFLALGSADATSTNFTVEMASDSYYEVPYGFTGRVSGLWSSADGAARISEMI